MEKLDLIQKVSMICYFFGVSLYLWILDVNFWSVAIPTAIANTSVCVFVVRTTLKAAKK